MSVLTHDSGEPDALKVRGSFERIEVLLNRGQRLLYGDEAGGDEYGAAAVTQPVGEPADAGAMPASYAGPVKHNPVHSDHPPHARQAMPSSASAGLRPRGGGAAPGPSTSSPYARLATPVSRAQLDQESSYQRLLAQTSAGAAGSKLRGSRVRGRPESPASGVKRRSARVKREDGEEVSASARGRMLVQMRKDGRRLPNLEEGVDERDTAQDYTIEELKERIRRELEEYRRNGPLMHRRKSFQLRNRAATSRVSTGPPVLSTAARSAKGSSERRVTGSAPLSLGPERRQVRTSPATAPASKVPARRVKAQPKSKSSGATPTTTTTTRTQQQRQTPFWERLYHDAAMQQERRDQRIEQRRVAEEKARTARQPRRVKPPAAPVHSAYSAYFNPLQMSGASFNDSRERTAQPRSGTNGVTVPPQHATYMQRRQPQNTPTASTAASKSSLMSTQSNGEAPERVVALRRASMGSASMSVSKLAAGAAAAPAAAPAPPPLPLKPKADAPSPTQVHAAAQAQSNEPYADDLEEVSSMDEEDACDRTGNVQPYISPLNLSGIKK